ncbi:MAG: T9SS type A sorting domain-containing protein [Bacteroidetes bacterium]|nr:T9SS type A sorting domain-containing protein [Bacteroidota bacterium]
MSTVTFTLRTLTVSVMLLLACISYPRQAAAQGAMSLSTDLYGTNGNYGTAFEVTANKSTKIHRIWVNAYSGQTTTVEIFYNPTGLINVPSSSTGYNATGWISLGTATISGLGYGTSVPGGPTLAQVEIPLDIDLLMNPGDRWGFITKMLSGGIHYRTGSPPYIFSDSYLTINTEGWAGGWAPLATLSMFFPRQFCGRITYDEGCFFPDNVISYELLDGNLQPTSFANVPGSLNIHYNVSYPDEAATVGVKVELRNVITDAVVYTHNFTASKLANQTLDGVTAIPLPANLPTGYFKVDVTFNSKNSCMNYADFIAPQSTLLLLPPGAQMCVVWPGDVDNNGLVNYGDRASLNKYIYEANMRSSWLEGPTRFSVVGGLDYLAWKAQPSAPWQTPDGCYKDTDGNGVINNFDYIAIKLNWQRAHSAIPAKQSAGFSTVSFDMDQNYPNPFNPTTSIRYTAPERSQVRMVVTDMLGREIATLVNDAVDAGVHTAQFDAGQLPSGNYIATVSMIGLESGLTFSKTVKMALNK